MRPDPAETDPAAWAFGAAWMRQVESELGRLARHMGDVRATCDRIEVHVDNLGVRVDALVAAQRQLASDAAAVLGYLRQPGGAAPEE